MENIDQVLNLIKDLEELYRNLSIITEKGYINDNCVSLPVVVNLIQHFNSFNKSKTVDKTKTKTRFQASKNPTNNKKSVTSIRLNTLYYNLVLLVMYRIIIMINK